LDSTGAWITGSFNDGIVDETIQEVLTTGTYYIQVSPDVLPDFSGRENTNYSLKLALLPIITVATTDASAGETLAGTTTNPGRFTLTRTGDLSQALTVNYTVTGTATNGTDYDNLTGTVSFAAGAATALVNLIVTDDTTLEDNETVILTLTSNANYGLGAAESSTLTIADNDALPDLAGNTLATARIVTLGGTASNFNDFVGNWDRDDYYKFTLTSDSVLDLK
ncbi:Calx-beta domain-containing protein, partial [Microcystis aeruginosa]